jgi:hypothetical protein
MSLVQPSSPVRALLDEQIPRLLGRHLDGHEVDIVSRRGWTGVKNGALLQLMHGEYDVFVTMDRGIEHQQNLARLSFGVLLIRAPSNRMIDLLPLVPAILEILTDVQPGKLFRVGS